MSLVNHLALRVAKTLLSFGHSVCNMIYEYTHSRPENFAIADPLITLIL